MGKGDEGLDQIAGRILKVPRHATRCGLISRYKLTSFGNLSLMPSQVGVST